VIGAFADIASRIAGRGLPLRVRLARALGLPRSAWGTAFAHAGLGVTLLGLAAAGWGVERIAAVKPGQTTDLGPYSVTIVDLQSRQGPNFSEIAAPTEIRRGGLLVATIDPSTRSFPVRQTSVTQAGIATLNFGQVYISLGDQHPDGSIDARMFWKPLVTAIWIGALIMAFGGAVSLSDRRLRIGFARKVARPRVPAAAPQPAE
jgi:cytochrome c-type biogenesis protein CcmF